MFTTTRRAPLILVAVLTIVASTARGQSTPELLTFGLYTGASVPSDNVSSIYDALDTLSLADSYRHASDMGLHIGGRVRFGLSEKISFSGSAAFCRFAGQDQTAVLNNGQTLTLQTATTFVPISAGVTAFAMRGLIAPYLTAEATYTYRTVTVATGNSLLQDLIVNSARLELEPSSTRIGATVAAGIQLNIGGLQPFAEIRHHWVNLVGTEEGEDPISFLNISFGLLF